MMLAGRPADRQAGRQKGQAVTSRHIAPLWHTDIILQITHFHNGIEQCVQNPLRLLRAQSMLGTDDLGNIGFRDRLRARIGRIQGGLGWAGDLLGCAVGVDDGRGGLRGRREFPGAAERPPKGSSYGRWCC